MKLGKWLKTAGKRRIEFAEMVGVSYDAVRLWELGERIPSVEIMARIKAATNGKVKANDFYG